MSFGSPFNWIIIELTETRFGFLSQATENNQHTSLKFLSTTKTAHMSIEYKGNEGNISVVFYLLNNKLHVVSLFLDKLLSFVFLAHTSGF